MFTRPNFEGTCKAYARRHPQWLWVDGPRPGYGYLTRSKSYDAVRGVVRLGVMDDLITDDLAAERNDLEPEDPAIAPSLGDKVHVQQYIVFAASFGMPAFYFTVHDSSGSPLSLGQLVRTAFFKADVPEDASGNPFALTVPSSPFPILSQGDHPTLGTPCWYIHPCEAERAVGEFMVEVEQTDWSESERLVRWMELWVMVVGAVVDAQA